MIFTLFNAIDIVSYIIFDCFASALIFVDMVCFNAMTTIIHRDNDDIFKISCHSKCILN